MTTVNKTSTDINRRAIDLDKYNVREVLPQFFQEEYPDLIKLLEYYFEHYDQPDNPAKILNDLYTIRDIQQVPEDLLLYIGEEVLLGDPYFENFASKRLSVLFSNTLYRSKGSKFSIEKFFKIFFNVDAEVEYPKKDIFTVGAPIRETQDYDLSVFEVLAGSNFTYNIFGDVTVLIDGVTLTEDVDYSLNTDTKTVSLLGTLGESFLTGSTLTIESRPDNFTYIGSDFQEKKIIDNRRYQLFSILIKSPLSINNWGSTYEKFVHPAGMYYQAQVSVVGSVDFSFGSQEISVPETPELLVETQSEIISESSFRYTDITGIVSDSADPADTTGKIRIALEPQKLSDETNNFADDTIIELGRQYGTIRDAYNIRPPLGDEDSAGLGLSRDSDSFVDISNAFELIDGNLYEDSDGLVTV